VGSRGGVRGEGWVLWVMLVSRGVCGKCDHSSEVYGCTYWLEFSAVGDVPAASVSGG
jgi:hypothetical protein